MSFIRLFDKSKTLRYAKFDKEEKMLSFGVEESMVKLFPARLSHLRSHKLPSDFGIKPENELPFRSSSVSCEALEIELDIVPLSLFPSR
jgi:hypothetical protein